MGANLCIQSARHHRHRHPLPHQFMAPPPLKRQAPVANLDDAEKSPSEGMDSAGLQAYVHLRGGSGFDEIIPQWALNYTNQRATSTFANETLVAIGLAHANMKPLRNHSPDHYSMKTIYEWKKPKYVNGVETDNTGMYRTPPAKLKIDLMGSRDTLDPRAVRVVMVRPIQKTPKETWVHLLYDEKVHPRTI